MRQITKSLFESLNKDYSGLTIKEYAINLLDGYIDTDVTDTEIDMLVAFSFDFNEEPDADFKAYSDFMNLIAERTKVVKVQNSNYGDTLVCDFSSVFKSYNEQLKEFFDMDNSEFNEDEAYYEAVANLEALISGNAGDSTYNELVSILNGKQITNEASNLESIIDEAARYLFSEGDTDYLPDYEEFNDSIMEISKDLFDKAKERALEALTNLAEHQYYDHDGGYGTVLELNDNHTMWELTNENKSDEEWASIVQSKQAQFKADTGVDLMLLGRMGRHACVEPTYDNCINFTYLQETQEKLEKEAIDEFNAEEMSESVNLKESDDFSVIEETEDYKLIKVNLLSDGDMSQECIEYIDNDGKSLGTVSYTIYGNGEYHIYTINVRDGQRRKGIATILMKALQREVGDSDIYFDTLTPSGKALLDKIADYDVYETGKLRANKYKGRIKNEINEATSLTAKVTYHDEDGTRDYIAGKLSDGRYFLIGQQEQIVVSDKDLPKLAKRDMNNFSYEDDGDEEFLDALDNGTTLDNDSSLAKIIINASRKYLDDGCYLLSESTNIEKASDNSIAKFIKDSVEKLQTTDYTNCKYDLDENLSLYVGWSDGYDAEETNEYEIHSKKNPTYVINAVIGVRNDADFADLDYITIPYYSNGGDVYNCQYTVSPSEDYTYLADTLMKAYKDIKNKIETGELLTESADVARDLGIEPGSDEEDMLNSLYNEKKIEWTDLAGSDQTAVEHFLSRFGRDFTGKSWNEVESDIRSACHDIGYANEELIDNGYWMDGDIDPEPNEKLVTDYIFQNYFLPKEKSENINESTSFDNIVLDSYHHLTNDLGKNPTIDDIVDDILNSYDQDYINDNTPEDSLQAFKDVKYVLRNNNLDFKDLDESATYEVDMTVENNLDDEIKELLKSNKADGVQYKVINAQSVSGGWPTVRFYGEDNKVREFLKNIGYEDTDIYRVDKSAMKFNEGDIDVDDSNNMETIRKYASVPEIHRGVSIRFDLFKVGSYEYDLRIYPGFTDRDGVRAALIPYKIDEEGRSTVLDKDIIDLDEFRLNMTDGEVRSLVRNKLDLRENLSEVDEADTEDVSGMRPIGVYTVSNNSAIYVYQIEYDIEDRVLVGDSSNETKAKWRDVIYDDNGEPYFLYGDIRIYFSEIMRTDI